MQKAIEKEVQKSGSKEKGEAFDYLQNAASEIVQAINRMIGTHPDISKRIERLEVMRF
jgi:Zn-dependent protease with chaperone function